MNKNNKKMKGFPKRALALILCCFCLMATVPMYVVAVESGDASITEEQTVENGQTPDPNASETEKDAANPIEPKIISEEEIVNEEEVVTEEEPVCNCNSANGIHAESCNLYVEPDVDTEAVNALFNQLMAFETYDELSDFMDGMTEEQYALMGYFTEEQEVALQTHINSLNENSGVILADLTIEQGQSGTRALENAKNYVYRVLLGNDVVSNTGISVSGDGNTVTISVNGNTSAGTYTIQYGYYYYGYWFGQEGSFTVEVTEAAADDSGTTTGPVVETKRMSYEKTATAKGDGTYDLELTLSGSVGSQTNKAKVDVIFIVDNSNSMYPNQSTYMSQLKPAMEALVDNLSTTNGDKIDARYALAMFGTDSEIRKTFTTASEIKTAIDNISAYSDDDDGGTNYQAGIYQGKQLLNQKRSDAMTIVVFVTDGLPTYRGAPNMNDGDGRNDNKGKNINAAVTEIDSMNCNYFYCIGIGNSFTTSGTTENTNMTKLTGAVNATSTGIYAAANGTVDELTRVFNTISAEVTTFLCKNVTITDILNHHEDGELMVQVTDPDTVLVEVVKNGTTIAAPAASVTLPETAQNKAATLTASYDTDTGTLTLDFPDEYQLEPDYVYKLKAVIEPTEKAYQEYRNGGYTDTGDSNTGTHSGQSGFYSNDSATVTYSYNNTNGTATYDHPVVQLNPGTLVVTKKFVNMKPEDVSGLSFDITLSTESKTMNVPFSQFMDADSDGVYTFEIQALAPNTGFSVEEKNAAVDGYNVTTAITTTSGTVDGSKVNGTVGKGAKVQVDYVNTYAVANTTITIDKIVTGNMGDRNKNFTFTVTVDDKTLGTYTLNHNTPIVTIENVPVGSTVTITESDNNGYVVSATVDDKTAEVINSTVTIKDISVNGHAVVFTNNKEVIIDTGISLETLPYILILGVVAVGAVLLIKRRRNREDD